MLGELPGAISLLAVPEDLDQDRTQLDRDSAPIGERLEQPDVLVHEIHSPLDAGHARIRRDESAESGARISAGTTGGRGSP